VIGTKWLAGTLLGLPLAVVLCTLGARWLPADWEGGMVIALMLSFVLWVAIISLSLLFATSRAAWLWLLAADLIGFGLLWTARLMHAVPPALTLTGA